MFAPSYQRRDGTIVDPIRKNDSLLHAYYYFPLEPDANLTYEGLDNASLFEANFTTEDLLGVYLIGTDLIEANLTGVILINVNLTWRGSGFFRFRHVRSGQRHQ